MRELPLRDELMERGLAEFEGGLVDGQEQE